MAIEKRPRRVNLATMVGSSLAVVAAGSLIAFSSLAEQAGLQGLATNGLQPAHPGRAGAGRGHVITVPPPATAPPGDPRDALVELVRDSVARSHVAALPLSEAPALEPRPRPEHPTHPDPERPRRIDGAARVAVAEPVADDADAPDPDGPPYGHAYGHYKKKHEPPKPAKKDPRPAEQPVYARSANDDEGSKPPKTPKLQKVKKAKKAKTAPGHSNGNANGHSKDAKANGHAQHGPGHGKGKGNGHSKHG